MVGALAEIVRVVPVGPMNKSLMPTLAFAESSASLKRTELPPRLIAGKLLVVPPNCKREKSVPAAFVNFTTPSEGEARIDRDPQLSVPAEASATLVIVTLVNVGVSLHAGPEAPETSTDPAAGIVVVESTNCFVPTSSMNWRIWVSVSMPACPGAFATEGP
jgi:hypothetical protein